MTKIVELDRKAWDEWVATRPACVQELCRRLPPDRLYKMKTTGHRVTIASYAENGTVRVVVGGEYNMVVFDREVFGVDADDLKECDPPNENEIVGTLFTQKEDIDAACAAFRANAEAQLPPR